MSKYRLLVDQDRCIACHACEAICKEMHGTPPGIRLGVLLVDGPRFEDAEAEATAILVRHGTPEQSEKPVAGNLPRVVMHTRYRACVQCPQPRCVDACPKKAMTRREQDGIVFVEEELCVGCGLCVKACPHHLVWIDPQRSKAIKCDQCRERLDAGEPPACVTVCPTQALQLKKKEHKS